MKALIKAIRATKTLADERALIVKESAVIRTAFKEEGKSHTHTTGCPSIERGGRVNLATTSISCQLRGAELTEAGCSALNNTR